MECSSKAIAFVLLLFGCVSAQAQFADVTCTFVYRGTLPVPQQVGIVNGVPIHSDMLRVNSLNSGISDITIFPVSADRNKPLDISKFDTKVQLGAPVIEHRGFQFVPHVVVMQAGQNLTIKNSDLTVANLNINFFDNTPPNLPMIPPGGQHIVNLPKAERGVSLVSCAMYGWMQASLFVLDHPFIGVSDADGQIALKGLAPGKTRFAIVHRLTKLTELKINGQAYPVTKGSFEIELQPGANDWGTIELSSQEFKR